MTSLTDVRWDPGTRSSGRVRRRASWSPPRTVTQWARLGLLEAHRTAGGHHRFRLSTIRRFARTLPTGARGQRRGGPSRRNYAGGLNRTGMCFQAVDEVGAQAGDLA